MKVILILLFLLLTALSIQAAEPKALDGFQRQYYDNGQLLSETNCQGENKTGFYREFYENGNLKMQVHYDSGKLEGFYADYCEDGSPRVRFRYKDNQIDGEYSLYYENGNLESKGSYKNSKEEGIHKMFYPGGQLAAVVMYKDGKEDGVARVFYNDGALWEESAYENGLRNGVFREYRPDGILKREVVYKNGEFQEAKDYDSERKVILEVLKEKFITNEDTKAAISGTLYRCVSHETGVVFACHPDWPLNREGKALAMTISKFPKVEFTLEETDQKLHYMSELTREAIMDLGGYTKNIHIERFRLCDRETVKVNGYSAIDEETRIADFYLVDHGQIHSIKFSIRPKQAWEDYQYLIKRIVESTSFIGQHPEKKFLLKKTNERCEELQE